MVAGVLSDQYQTRRVPFLVGLVALFFSTLLFAFARTLVVLVVARILQGLSTAVVTTIGYALIADVYGGSASGAGRNEEQKGVGRAMGWVSMCVSLGWFVGPIVGGWIYDRAGYTTVFGPALACVGVDIMLRLLMAEPEKRRNCGQKAPAVEVPRPVVANEDNERGYGTTTNVSTASSVTRSGSPCTTCSRDSTSRDSTRSDEQDHQQERRPLLRRSRAKPEGGRPEHAMLVLISSFPLMTTIVAATVLFALLSAFDAVLPVFLKDRYGLGSAQISLIFIALVVPLCLSPAFGALADRVGTVGPSVVGFVLGALSLWALGYLEAVNTTISGPEVPEHSANHQLWSMIPILVAIGLSFSIVLPAMNSAVSHSVSKIEAQNPGVFGTTGAYAQAYGLSHAGLGLGMVIGPVGAGLIKERAGWMAMTFMLAAFSVLGMILVLALRADEILTDRRYSVRNRKRLWDSRTRRL